MHHNSISGTDIQYAAELLRNGEVVAIPTETVYGLAANAFDTNAVVKIFQTKNRPRFNPLIVHIASISKIETVAIEKDPILIRLAETFWPGPLTILYRKKDVIHDLVTAGSEMVALRVPDHQMTLELLQQLAFPLAAPSANEFGRVSPTSARHVTDQLGNKIKYVLDGGESKVGVESTIVKVENGKVFILRPGGISSEQIASLTGELPLIQTGGTIEAPGMLKSHYAPKIPLIVGDLSSLLPQYNERKIAVMTFTSEMKGENIIANKILSPSGDLSEAARNLFSVLHELENSDADLILSEYFPAEGLGVAINDRLSRAGM